MLFGLQNAGQSFQQLMNTILQGLQFAFVYNNDVLIASRNPEEHLDHLWAVLGCLFRAWSSIQKSTSLGIHLSTFSGTWFQWTRSHQSLTKSVGCRGFPPLLFHSSIKGCHCTCTVFRSPPLIQSLATRGLLDSSPISQHWLNFFLNLYSNLAGWMWSLMLCPGLPPHPSRLCMTCGVDCRELAAQQQTSRDVWAYSTAVTGLTVTCWCQL